MLCGDPRTDAACTHSERPLAKHLALGPPQMQAECVIEMSPRGEILAGAKSGGLIRVRAKRVSVCANINAITALQWRATLDSVGGEGVCACLLILAPVLVQSHEWATRGESADE